MKTLDYFVAFFFFATLFGFILFGVAGVLFKIAHLPYTLTSTSRHPAPACRPPHDGPRVAVFSSAISAMVGRIERPFQRRRKKLGRPGAARPRQPSLAAGCRLDGQPLSRPERTG